MDACLVRESVRKPCYKAMKSLFDQITLIIIHHVSVRCVFDKCVMPVAPGPSILHFHKTGIRENVVKFYFTG